MFKERTKDRCNQSSCRFDNIKYNIALKQSMLPGNVGSIEQVFYHNTYHSICEEG